MSSLRPSDFPSFVLSTLAAPEAPQDVSTQLWLKQEAQTSQHPEALAHLARLMDKALDGSSPTADLSTGDPVALRRMSPGLIGRLASHVRLLKLPVDCPPEVARQWQAELPNTEVVPRPLAGHPEPRPVRQPQVGCHGVHRRVEAPATSPPIAPPRLPGPAHADPPSDFAQPSEFALQAADHAVRTLRAWLCAGSSRAAGDDRTLLPASNANALAQALSIAPERLPTEARKALINSNCMLARRAPLQDLPLSAEQVRQLDRALAAVSTLARSAAREPVRRLA